MQMEKYVKQTPMTLLVSGGKMEYLKIMQYHYLCGKSTCKPISFYNKYIQGELKQES